MRERVGLLDIASFSRYEVTGPEAGLWLDSMTVARLPNPGRARLAPMLSEAGKLKGDLTVINWGDGTFWIEGSYYLRAWHMRWFADHAREGVDSQRHFRRRDRLFDRGPQGAGALGAGHASGRLQRRHALHGRLVVDVGLVRARVARISVVGELGYEINCRALDTGPCGEPSSPPEATSASRNMATTPSTRFGLRELWRLVGGIHPSLYAAHDRHGPLDRLGQGRFRRQRSGARGSRRAAAVPPLVTLEIDALDADASGYEPVWREGARSDSSPRAATAIRSARASRWRSSRRMRRGRN